MLNILGMDALDRLINSGFTNIPLLEEMYTLFQEDPKSVDSSWQELFSQMDDSPQQSNVERVEVKPISKGLRAYHLIQAYRTYGHLLAQFNPIRTHSIEEPWQLKLETLKFSEDELTHTFPTYGIMSVEKATLQEIIDTLKEIYCKKIGVEYMGVQNPELEEWLQQQIEPGQFRVDLGIEQKKIILQNLNKTELFEVFLHTKYVGQKRFSLEGGETLIPILAGILNRGEELGASEFVLGMAHRGRLNVLSNIMHKSYFDIFSEFEEGYIPDSIEGSGDVKYHKGFTSRLKTNNGKEVTVTLTPNPSHLEAVDGVVEGFVRAKQVQIDNDQRRDQVIPILIHGDAALAGQGVVYETMQLYNLKEYSTGGTIHIVVNNQIGFTTLPAEGRSTRYCTDIAKTFSAPVFHVNAEDPEGCYFATRLALEIRQKFHCDVFIDINCYRKYGHNEGDEPAFTQPLEYKIIRSKKPIREMYRDDLITQGVLEKEMAEKLEEEFRASLQKELTEIQISKKEPKHIEEQEFLEKVEVNLFPKIKTAVNKKLLSEVTERISHIPEGFTINRKLERLVRDRRAMVEDTKPIDWGMGETLAYATLLWEAVPIRLCGQDTCRGTFSHRHAQWMDQVAERAYYPLKHLKRDQGRFDVINSPLTEFAGLGFEYGYSVASPDTLTVWEAQFGDFSNGAQVIIDQFIATAEQKWGQKSRLALLLPHGYEGQGPEHSSARIERYLTLCGNNNMRVVYPTLPGQLFHLLRRQALNKTLKPLVVFTPKGLLRHPECVSHIDDLTKGSFQEILDDPTPPKKVKKLVFCSGRIFYDLDAERKSREVTDMAIIRVEQLYPLNREKLKELIEKYSGFEECFWVQEEPKNMGAYGFIRFRLQKILPRSMIPKYVGRARSASPAAGSFSLHKKEHASIMEALFETKRSKT